MERVWTPPRLQALCSITSRYDCLRVSGLIVMPSLSASDPDGLFARRLPIAYTSSNAPRSRTGFVNVGSTCSPSNNVLCNRGGGLLRWRLIHSLIKQSGGAQRAPDRMPYRYALSPKPLVPSCWPVQPSQH